MVGCHWCVMDDFSLIIKVGCSCNLATNVLKWRLGARQGGRAAGSSCSSRWEFLAQTPCRKLCWQKMNTTSNHLEREWSRGMKEASPGVAHHAKQPGSSPLTESSLGLVFSSVDLLQEKSFFIGEMCIGSSVDDMMQGGFFITHVLH